MQWIEDPQGCWTSEAGVVITTDGEFRCLANEVGVVSLAKECTIEDAKRAVEAAYEEHRVDSAAQQSRGTAGRRGRKPKGPRPMTAAERQAARMERMRRKVADAVNTVQHLSEISLDAKWDRRRIEIRRWLETQAPPLAAVYQEIVTLIHMPESPARLHFVAHGIREIGNRLPGYLDEISSDQVRYPALVKPIFTLWEKAGLPLDDAPFPALIENAQVPGENEVKIPVELAGRIAVLLRKHAEGEARTRKKSAVLFDALKKEAGIATGGAQYTVKRWDFVRDWAVKNAHVDPKGPKCTHAEMQDRFNEFERILYALVASFVDVLGDVDRILLAAPSEENIDAVIALLSRGGARNYFFERENDSEWLRALDEKKYFDDLLEGEHWPELAFLTRMATREPERVTQILERLTKKRGTIVKIHLIDIATALPPSHATRLTKRIAEIADAELRPFTRWYGFGLPKLIVHLAGGGEGNAAFRLFDAMYSVRRTRSGGVSEEVSFTGTSNDLWQLQEGLKSILPALAAVNAKMLIQSLCSKLKAAAEARGHLGPNFDYSASIGWQLPAVTENGSALDIAYNLEGLLAIAIFQAARLAIRSGFVGADEAVGLIERKQGQIFKRVSFSLLASVAPEASEKAIVIMAKPSEFDDTFLRNSYGRLLQVRFAELSPEQRKSILRLDQERP